MSANFQIQLIDARERYTPMKRSLGDKRRYLDQAALDTVTHEHGAMENSKTSRVFDNADFGYRRIAVLRPLRLRFEITEDARERFLNTCPELFDALPAVQDQLGSEPHLDWNRVWDEVQQVFKTLPDDVEGWSKGTAQKKIFRDCFTVADPDAAPVIAKHHKVEPLNRAALFPGQTLPIDITKDELYALLGLCADGKGKHIKYEPDPALKDTESFDVTGSSIRLTRRFGRHRLPNWQDGFRRRRNRERFQSMTREVSSSLPLFFERRAALITAAVTGQVPLEEMRP